MITISKDFLKDYRFSDNPNAWALEARSMLHIAELSYLDINTPSQRKSGLISMPDSAQKLNQKLIAKGVLEKTELHEETLQTANILLEWSGRYVSVQRTFQLPTIFAIEALPHLLTFGEVLL